ncbi:MAG: ATP-binding protein [Cyanobacteriota bacterium]|nr:ATP-binding protein [Cyanobacteriota bacterium]
MKLDPKQFFQACNPAPLDLKNPDRQRYYINFAEVRGENVIKELQRGISLSEEEASCQLFTGHIGCGKSTELSQLQAQLEKDGFHVVYFKATEDLDVADVDLTDILLAIARQVSASLERSKIELQPKGFKAFLKQTADFLQQPIELSAEGEIAGMKGKVSTEKGVEVSLPLGLAKITAKAKSSPQTRSKLRQFLEPQTPQMLNLIDEEIISVAKEKLKQQGQKGLVVIVDNLDRIEYKDTSSSNKPLPEYLFVDRGEQLREIKCHLVYTLPLALNYSNEREALKSRLGGGSSPIILPMVPARNRNGEDNSEGMELLRYLVVKRAFPEARLEEYSHLVTEIFDSPETLDKLCRVSGGHVRNLVGMLRTCLTKDDPPISGKVLDKVIKKERDGLLAAIDEEEWELLFKVEEEQEVKGDIEYQMLLRSLFVFQYQDDDGSWYSLNPLLFESKKYQSR